MSKLRAAFDEERAWLRACHDEGAVIDRMAGYRDNMAFARRVGNAQAHAFAEHLVELAEDRLTMLKVGATKAKERPAAPTTARVVQPLPAPEPPARPRAEPARVDDPAVVRQLQAALAASQEAERRATSERDAADRRARQASAERDSVVASRNRAPAVSLAQPAPTAPPPVNNGGSLSLPATLPSAPSSAKPSSAARSTTATTTAPRPPQTSTASPPAAAATSRQERPNEPGERPPSPKAPTPPPAVPVVPPMSPTAPRSCAAPAARTDGASAALTGADLAAFRRGAGLNQVAAAQRLGVTQGTISKAEGNPRTVLGPALQEALSRVAG